MNAIDSLNRLPEPEQPRAQFRLFLIVIVLGLIVLVGQLFQLQILNFKYYTLAADLNRYRLLDTDAPRGIVYDRNGEVLVRNVPAFHLAIVPADLPEEQQDAVLKKLSALLDVPLETRIEAPASNALGSLPADIYPAFIAPTRKPGLRELVEQGRLNPFTPVVLKTNVPRETALVLEERHLEFPGLQVGVDPIRQYPLGALTAHVLGYVGAIPPQQYDECQKEATDAQPCPYVVTDQVGLSGIEYAYEDELRGYKGKRNVEVDVAGRELARLAEVLPRPGHNLYLTLDVQFQKAVEEVLRKGMRNAHAKQGVVVALNPQNGEVLAMVSLPAYDDNLFATPIKPEDYEALTEDPLRPLVNHAIIGQYPPGSTFKLVPASGALQEGILNDKTIVKTPGVIWLPNKYFPDDPQLAQPFYDWYKPGFGQLTIREGIAQSSDVFFYKVSGGFPDDFPNGLGLDLFDKYARAFGFGEPTGMDLPGEASGLTPDAAWKRKTFGESWSTGDTYNMGIGQGFVLATPLQLANMAAIVANGGKFYRPHLARAIVDADGKVVRKIEPQLVRSVGVDPQYLQVVREGMRGAVTHGTAWKANLAEVEVAGKTGTAEYFGPRVNGYLPTHAWFIAFAPYENPEIALVVFVAGGGEGSEVAVPIAVDVLRAYFHLPADSPLAGYTAPPPPPESRNAGASVTPRKYAGALIGVEDWNNELPGIFGVVVDKNGRGVPGVRLSVDKGDGNPVTTLTTDTNGAFRYDELDFHVSSRWYARIISPGDSEPVEINVLPYKRYNLQFTATQ